MGRSGNPARAPRRPRPRAAWLGALGAGLALLTAPAGAVITTVTDTTGGNYQLLLRVGSAAGVDTVSFNVSGPAVAVNPQPVAGTPAIDVWVQPLRPSGNTTVARPVTLAVDSSTPLQCDTPVSCGATTIPFSKISWQASNNGGAGDIQNGVFSGGANQQIASFNANATFCSFPIFIFCLAYEYQTSQLNATRMSFTYANDQIYPAGVYRGTVRITATLL